MSASFTDGRFRVVSVNRAFTAITGFAETDVIGRINDVTLYRELVRRGVSDYVIAPVNTIDVVRSVCGLFSAPEAKAVGRIIAIVGAKGGVGASTIAHNVAWAIARDLALDSVVIDLDLAFGTAGLDYNQDPPQGIADAVFAPDRVDTAFVDRLLSKCTDHLNLLAAPATLDRRRGAARRPPELVGRAGAPDEGPVSVALRPDPKHGLPDADRFGAPQGEPAP